MQTDRSTGPSLAHLMLEFFAQSDLTNKSLYDNKASVEDYQRRTRFLIRAAKSASHEAITRYLRDGIPWPWEGETLE